MEIQNMMESENVKYINDYENFKEFVDNISPTETRLIHMYFFGSKDEDGKSWCDDCEEASPHIQNALDKYLGDSMLVKIDVGTREIWKDMENPFRLDKNVHLTTIPALLKWGKHHRLDSEQCKKDDLLELYFTADDD